MKEERDRRPHGMGYYIFSGIKLYTLPLDDHLYMQFFHALDPLLHDIVVTDPPMRPVYMINIDIYNRFYCIDLNPEDAPNLVLTLPSLPI